MPRAEAFSRIVQRGRHVLNKKPSEINTKFLEQYPEFIEFRARRRESEQRDVESVPDNRQTPAEVLESAYQKLREDLSTELRRLGVRNRSHQYSAHRMRSIGAQTGERQVEIAYVVLRLNFDTSTSRNRTIWGAFVVPKAQTLGTLSAVPISVR